MARRETTMRTTRRVLVLGVVFALGVAAGVSTMHAQPIPGRELLNLENGYVAASIGADAERYMNYWHEAFVTWPDDESMPLERSFAEDMIRDAFENRKESFSTPMLEPFSYVVEGDSGLTHYRVEYTATDANGEKEQRIYRTSHFWVRIDGDWKLLGESIAFE